MKKINKKAQHSKPGALSWIRYERVCHQKYNSFPPHSDSDCKSISQIHYFLRIKLCKILKYQMKSNNVTLKIRNPQETVRLAGHPCILIERQKPRPQVAVGTESSQPHHRELRCSLMMCIAKRSLQQCRLELPKRLQGPVHGSLCLPWACSLN